MKSGFISITGRPNVGKSTLLNAILGEKIAITTDKPQTTRNRIRGIYTDDDSQMVFLDTPGIHKPRNKLGEYMTETAFSVFDDVDVILFLTDDRLDAGPGDRFIVDRLANVDTPKYLVINKIDKLGPEKYREIFEEYSKLGIFDGIFGISALKGKNISDIITALKNKLDEGPAYFPPDMITDHPERFIVSEIIREKLLMYLDEEVPHGVAVEIESYEEEPDITRIGAVIYCERRSHKGIIIGKNGRKLKGVGKSAREEIQRLTGTKVYLRLWVKVKENWRDSDFMLSNFGYKDK
ncbi:MAG: GTPase Era [Eubacteriaceae bacterium]|nr:GTPase Era [Eubacteriaceae bacterium]